MQASQSPTLVPLAFAANGNKNTIPEASQISTNPGAASLNDGFPPATMTPIAAGGTPMSGPDLNGILNLATQSIRWQHAGGHYSYNAAFANDTNVGGYPRGALLLRSDQSGMWLNQTDNNATNPDTGGAGWTPAFMSGVVGQVRNLTMNVAAASASATLNADEIVVGSALGGQKYVLPSFSKTINLATTGAGGIDTGSAPVSGFVALYAIYNPTTQTAALLATNATSAVAPNVYGGANIPSGYTASALVSVWQTNSSSQFQIGIQRDRHVSFPYRTLYSATTIPTSITSLSISGAVPLNAVRIGGSLGMGSATTTNTFAVYIYSSNNGIGQQQAAGYCVSGGAAAANFVAEMVAAQTIYYSGTVSSGATFSIYAAWYDF